jgi:anti-sigma B factor antagonist
MSRDELYSTTTVGPAMVVVFKPHRLLDFITVEKMGASLKELVDAARGTPLVFDFSRVSHLSSAALGLLIGLERRVIPNGGRMILAGLSDDLLEIFRITRLDGVFDICGEVKDAIALLEKGT